MREKNEASSHTTIRHSFLRSSIQSPRIRKSSLQQHTAISAWECVGHFLWAAGLSPSVWFGLSVVRFFRVGSLYGCLECMLGTLGWSFGVALDLARGEIESSFATIQEPSRNSTCKTKHYMPYRLLVFYLLFLTSSYPDNNWFFREKNEIFCEGLSGSKRLVFREKNGQIEWNFWFYGYSTNYGYRFSTLFELMFFHCL